MTRNWPVTLCALIGICLLGKLLIPNWNSVHSSGRMEMVYVCVNQHHYATYSFNGYSPIELNLKKGDRVQFTLIENPILAYSWQSNAPSKFGFKRLSHQILRPMQSQPLLSPREELRYDRSVFDYEFYEKGSYEIHFLYSPDDLPQTLSQKMNRCIVTVIVQ